MEIIVIAVILIVIFTGQALIYKKFGLYGIEYKMSLSVNEAFEGDIIEVIEEVSNKKILPVPWLKSEITTSRWLEFVGTKAATASDTRFVPSVFVLKPNQKCTRTWKVKCLKRGVFTMDRTSVVSCDIFGLVSSEMAFNFNETLTVLPTPSGELAGDMSNRELFGDIIVRRFVCEDPFIISGSREYTGREPMSHIHSNSTAKQNKLMVFNNEYTTTNTALVIMNMQRSENGEPIAMHISYTETYIKASTFFIDKCFANHIKIGFATNGHIRDKGVYIPPDNTQQHVYSLLSLFAELENQCSMSIGELLDSLDYTFVTDIFLLTTYIDDNMLAVAAYLKSIGKNIIFYCNEEVEMPYQLVRTGVYGCYSIR